jgi:multidrug resistance efflux pump
MTEQNNQNSTDILKEEKAILKEERQILGEIKKEGKIISRLNKKIYILILLAILVISGGLGGYLYWRTASARVYVELSQVSAPQIDLTPSNSDVLKNIFVNVGDQVPANFVVAQVGEQLIKTEVAGIITDTNGDIGKIFSPQQPVVSMIDPNELRIVGRVEEDKGLKDIHIGQKVIFSVDAFSGKEYYGIVDEISPTSYNSGIIFNISDKRQMQQFEVKARFDIGQYPELKNGMSAKMWIYKN